MKKIRWGWILLGGFLAELAIFVIVIPLSLVAGQGSLLYSAPPASFAAAFVFGVCVANKASDRRVVHGALVGVAAILIYLAVSLGRPEPMAYVIAHVLKVLGGAAGGLVAMARERRFRSAASV
jgi:putative membrane protein (TIGR04086 family)